MFGWLTKWFWYSGVGQTPEPALSPSWVAEPGVAGWLSVDTACSWTAETGITGWTSDN